MNCKTNSRLTYRRGAMRDTVFIVLVLALIGWGLYHLIKMWGSATHQYTTSMIQAEKKAEDLACQENLQAIYEALMICSTSGEPLPQSKDELLKWCGGTKTFKCPDPNGSEYVYIPPKSMDDPTARVIVYEPNAVHNNQSHVLLSDGSIESVSPEQLQALLKTVNPRGRP